MPTRPRSKSSERQRNVRGNSRDRAARRAWLLATFDAFLGPHMAFCHLKLSPHCMNVVTASNLSVDRINPGGSYCRDNIQPACPPCQSHQGGMLGSERIRKASSEQILDTRLDEVGGRASGTADGKRPERNRGLVRSEDRRDNVG